MTDVRRAPYYRIKKSLFGSELREFKAAKGCIPLDTPKGVSLERPAPGAKQSLSHTPPAAAATVKKAAQRPRPEQVPKSGQTKTRQLLMQLDAEVYENPPIFDLQDVPDAMDKLGWPVSAKLARMWFAGLAHTYDDQPASEQPLTRRALFGKFKEPDVYFPVFNDDYNRWREKHQRGGDFMVYSKPLYLKLKKPIDLKLGEICRLEPLNSLA